MKDKPSKVLPCTGTDTRIVLLIYIGTYISLLWALLRSYTYTAVHLREISIQDIALPPLDEHYVAVVHHVVSALCADAARLLGRCKACVREQLLRPHDLGADKPAADVAMQSRRNALGCQAATA